MKLAFSRNVNVLDGAGGTVVDAQPVAGSPNLYRADVASTGLTFFDTQAVFFRWIVEYHVFGSSTTTRSLNPIDMFRVGCPGGATAFNAALLADQAAVVGAFGSTNRPDLAPGLIATHRDVRPFTSRDLQFTGMGHEAGFHQSTASGGPQAADGAFLPTPPSESIAGTANASPPADPHPPWHGRGWDIHIWRSFDGTPPRVGIFNPSGAPTTGVGLPAGSFFTLPADHPLRVP